MRFHLYSNMGTPHPPQPENGPPAAKNGNLIYKSLVSSSSSIRLRLQHHEKFLGGVWHTSLLLECFFRRWYIAVISYK